MGALRQRAKSLLHALGYDIVRYPATKTEQEYFSELPVDMSSHASDIFTRVKPYTKTSPERVMALLQSTQHITSNNITGDIVECGVWKGGSMMAVAYSLLELGDTTRTLYLFDTYEGMTPPTEKDISLTGQTANEILDTSPKGHGSWCVSSLDTVRENMLCTGYPEEKIVFVKGPVEETIPQKIPENIALARLDTDWYESTLHELRYLYPQCSTGGILIIDDYGHWQGAKQATDEFFKCMPSVFLHRIDYTGRLIIKP